MGLAYLPDGSRMDYEQYIRTPEWKRKRSERLLFDFNQCGICHKDIRENDRFETHHLNYSRLGHEDIEKDLITLCKECHDEFHSVWQRTNYWTDNNPLAHWRDYSLPDTAAFCIEYLEDDYMFGGDYNLCSEDVISQFIDSYYSDHALETAIYICVTDIKLFFRNARYDLFFESNKAGEQLDEMLDRMFGPKGMKGGNKKRSAARAFFSKHKPSAMKRIYKENDNILILMKEVEKIRKEQK